MDDLFLAPMGDVFAEGVCFDARHALLLGNRSALGDRRPGHRGRAVPVGPPPSLALAAIPIRRVAAQASPSMGAS
jgi:hypothetical protein